MLTAALNQFLTACFVELNMHSMAQAILSKHWHLSCSHQATFRPSRKAYLAYSDAFPTLIRSSDS